MSLLINFFCFNSCTDPFCLVLQLQALCLQRLAFRSSHNSLSSVSLSAIVFILFLMLILCLVLLSLSLHACSHNADRRGNTKGRGNWGAELKISSHGQKKTTFFLLFFPQAVYVRTFQLENKIRCHLLLLSLFFGSLVVREVARSVKLPFTKL